jgi:hypothetical protein
MIKTYETGAQYMCAVQSGELESLPTGTEVCVKGPLNALSSNIPPTPHTTFEGPLQSSPSSQKHKFEIFDHICLSDATFQNSGLYEIGPNARFKFNLTLQNCPITNIPDTAWPKRNGAIINCARIKDINPGIQIKADYLIEHCDALKHIKINTTKDFQLTGCKSLKSLKGTYKKSIYIKNCYGEINIQVGEFTSITFEDKIPIFHPDTKLKGDVKISNGKGAHEYSVLVPIFENIDRFVQIKVLKELAKKNDLKTMYKLLPSKEKVNQYFNLSRPILNHALAAINEMLKKQNLLKHKLEIIPKLS